MLTPRKRISKKELKEDKLVTIFFKSKEWLESNIKFVFSAVVAVLVVLFAALLFSNMQKKSEEKASVLLSQALRIYNNSDYQNAITSLEQLSADYGKTKSGKIGRFYLASAYFKTGDFESAQSAFDKFASSFNGDSYLKAAGIAGSAASFEQQQKYLQAAEKYENLAKKYPETAHASRYLFRAARCYKLTDNLEKSKELLNKIIEDYPDSNEKDDASLLLAMQ